MPELLHILWASIKDPPDLFFESKFATLIIVVRLSIDALDFENVIFIMGDKPGYPIL